MQGITAQPGLIFHWRFPRFFSEELRWLATYVALSRPPSLAQLVSVGLPASLRSIIEGGPPEGVLSRFADMFSETEQATHAQAARLLRELQWDRQACLSSPLATEQPACYRAGCLLQSPAATEQRRLLQSSGAC